MQFTDPNRTARVSLSVVHERSPSAQLCFLVPRAHTATRARAHPSSRTHIHKINQLNEDNKHHQQHRSDIYNCDQRKTAFGVQEQKIYSSSLRNTFLGHQTKGPRHAMCESVTVRNNCSVSKYCNARVASAQLSHGIDYSPTALIT